MFDQGQQFGEYTLVRKLGRGAFGEVWLAETQDEKFAIKFPLADQVDWKQITQEIGLWVLCGSHPNILRLKGARNFNGQIAIISEYAPEGSLEDLLRKKGKFTVEETLEMAIEILEGLVHLHEHGIIHRDLKPANILLSYGLPVLADFGISRIVDTDSQSQTVAGTFAYMAPESFDGQRNVQTDIWAAGVIFYRMLTGHLPFAQKDAKALIGSIIMQMPEPLPDTVPAKLQYLLMKMLNKSPSERFQDAIEVLDYLKVCQSWSLCEDVLVRDHFRDILAEMKSTSCDLYKEFIQINEYAQEFLRLVFGEIHYQKTGLESDIKYFDGLFLEPDQLKTVCRVIKEAIHNSLEVGYEEDDLHKLHDLAKHLEESSATFMGTVSLYVYDEAIPKIRQQRTKYFETKAQMEILRIATMDVSKAEKNRLMSEVAKRYGTMIIK